jgi:C4-dicarboxylate-specific signal transduction histidine kinase
MSAAKTSQRTVFRPRARLLSLLGEQLISDQAVGLIELVKNAYDADATTVNIELSGLRDIKTTRILLRDNGCGMTRDDIEQKWLSPAVSHKERQKKSHQRTKLGRLPIGEKGVGRFAVQQLGRRFQLISRAAHASEVVVEIDWDNFDREDAFLSEIELSLSERAPEIFTGNATGTMLLIEHARTLWTESLVAKVQRALRRLQSPHQGSTKVDFTITFICPDFPAYQDIQNSDILDRAHYFFAGAVTSDGILDYEYRCRHPALPRRSIDKRDHNLVPAAAAEMHGPTPCSGPFYLNFYVWDRTPAYLQQSQVSRADLDAIAGVSIFRDGLRILPYGESGNDWLDLDKERINNMADRIGNQQIVGYVEILQEETLALRDKTDRQGLIENDAFRDLRALVRATINVFISHWLQDRPKPNKSGKERAPENPDKNALEQARKLVERAVNSTSTNQPDRTAAASAPQPGSATCQAASTVPPAGTRLPPFPEASGQQPASAAPANPAPQPVSPNNNLPSVSAASAPETTEPILAAPLAQREELLQLLDLLNAAADYQRMTETSNEQQQQILMHLAGTGMAAERVVHEFGRQVNAARALLGELRTTSRGNAAVLSVISSLEACIETLRNEIRVLAPYEAGIRLQRIRLMKILEPIQTAIALNKQFLDSAAISLEIQGADFEVAGRPAPLVQVFDNLINNACNWLETRAGERLIRVILDSNSRTVTLADNGPGVPEHMRESIFQPFISMRNNGRGLGLYITRELLNAMRASIELTTVSPAGASFLLKFPGSIVQSSQK